MSDVKKALTDPTAILKNPKTSSKNGSLAGAENRNPASLGVVWRERTAGADEEGMSPEGLPPNVLDAVLNDLRSLGAAADVD